MVKFTAIFQNTINYFSKKPNNAEIVSRAKQYSGEYPKALPFSSYYIYYHQTPSVKRNINSIHRRWMGSSMEVQSQDKTFDSLWKEFAKITNFKPMIKEFALDTLITGTGMIEKQFWNNMFANLSHIPTKTLWRIYRDEFANILSIWQLTDGDTKELSPKNMLIFTINNPERDAIGKSAMYAVAVPQIVGGKVDELGNPIDPQRYLPSILDVKTRLNFAHMEIAEKQAKSRWFVSLKSVKDATRQKQIEADLENDASSKYITVTDGDVDVKGIEFKSQVGNERYLDDIDEQINRGTGFPGNVIDKGASMGYASSQTPMQDLSSSIEDMQNDLSEFVEDGIFKPLCEQWGLDYDKVQPKLIFNTFVEKVTFEQLIKIPPTAPIADTELRKAYNEFLPGMDDTEWKKFKEERDAKEAQALQAKGGTDPKNPRPDVEKGMPKPDKSIEYILQNPKQFENYLGDLVKEKAKEYLSSFALPPTGGEPFKAPNPEVTNAEILNEIKELLKKVKSGVKELPDEESDKSMENTVGDWVKELKEKHQDWSHDQIIAVAIKKSKESAKRLEKDGTDYWDNEEIQKQLAIGIKVEMEHTQDPKEATGIAMDHLAEYPDYYTRLSKVIPDVPKTVKTKESKARKTSKKK